ncbi:uncharacterized protein [Asterias amurensis]|uniref:uncharacterized protein isoform X1 n=1 Tax=Asterias amurensis TaxID=7602 RepID=UPI003AB6D8C6
MDVSATYSFSLPGRRIDGGRFLEVANDLLVFRKFDDVLRMCSATDNVLPLVKLKKGINGHNVGVDDENNRALGRDDVDEDIANRTTQELNAKRSFHESLCILAIQAYAETDQWDRVTPFLSQYYEAVARYPVIIIKLCILLHVKVNNLSAAETLALEWLSDNVNQTLPQYSSILELLLSHVLLPQTKIEQAKELVELNPQLSPEKKMTLLKYLEKVEEDLRVKKAVTDNQSTNDTGGSSLLRIIHRLGQLITRLVPIAGLRYIRDIACLGFFIYLIAVRTNLDGKTCYMFVQGLHVGSCLVIYSPVFPMLQYYGVASSAYGARFLLPSISCLQLNAGNQ